ncbi:hypothetical protein J6590_056788 [Homalodisca vitripennis]|nr:hypothetical protein J6590_056788 [Homalodisca vitripennis]
MFPTLALHDHDPKTTSYEHKNSTENQEVTNTSYSVLQPCPPHWPCTTTTPRPPPVFPTLALHDHEPQTTSYEHKDGTEIQEVTNTSYSVLQPCSPHWPCTTTTSRPPPVFPTLDLLDHEPQTTSYEHKDGTEIQEVTNTSYSVLQPCSPHWPCTTTTTRPPRMSTKMAPRFRK